MKYCLSIFRTSLHIPNIMFKLEDKGKNGTIFFLFPDKTHEKV